MRQHYDFFNLSKGNSGTFEKLVDNRKVLEKNLNNVFFEVENKYRRQAFAKVSGMKETQRNQIKENWSLSHVNLS